MNDVTVANPEWTAIVEEGVKEFEEAEVRARKAQRHALNLPAIFERANAAGMTQMGALKTHRMMADACAAAGLLAQAEALLWRLHREATDIAIANGVDVVIIAGGGDR